MLDDKYSFNQQTFLVRYFSVPTLCRTEYLSSKKFTDEQISSLLVRHPQILNIDVVKLDGILGFYSKMPTNYERRKITYSAEELRNIVVRYVFV